MVFKCAQNYGHRKIILFLECSTNNKENEGKKGGTVIGDQETPPYVKQAAAADRCSQSRALARNMLLIMTRILYITDQI